MRKFISLFLLLGMLASGAQMGCTTKSPQQKKTERFKRSQRLGVTPCPCNAK